MRLGFHYHEPLYRTSDGRLRTSGPQSRFLDALASECEELVCFLYSPRDNELPYTKYVVRSPNIAWVSLGPHLSMPARMLRGPLNARLLRSWRHKLDTLLIRGPSPLLPALARAVRPLPVALLLVGDYVKVVRDSPQPAWRKVLIGLWARANVEGQTEAARGALTLVNSSELYERLRLLPHVYKTRTTTLTSDDFFRRRDTCDKGPVRLLYTGRMDRGKGLLVLVEALGKLVGRGEDVVLDLVGRRQSGDDTLSEALAVAKLQGIRARVIYHGFRTLGADLFQFYKRADIFVLASVRTEGFPRSVWEAMAHSLPVVATGVGSIPYDLRDGHMARLVAPRDPEALAQGISDVIHNRDLRGRLIVNGFTLAQTNTLEKTTRELMKLVKSWSSEQVISPLARGAAA